MKYQARLANSSRIESLISGSSRLYLYFFTGALPARLVSCHRARDRFVRRLDRDVPIARMSEGKRGEIREREDGAHSERSTIQAKVPRSLLRGVIDIVAVAVAFAVVRVADLTVGECRVASSSSSVSYSRSHYRRRHGARGRRQRCITEKKRSPISSDDTRRGLVHDTRAHTTLVAITAAATRVPPASICLSI